jgi:hypothetical protein
VLVPAGTGPANVAYLDVAAGQGDADLVDLGTVKVLLGLVVCLPLASKRAVAGADAGRVQDMAAVGVDWC